MIKIWFIRISDSWIFSLLQSSEIRVRKVHLQRKIFLFFCFYTRFPNIREALDCILFGQFFNKNVSLQFPQRWSWSRRYCSRWSAGIFYIYYVTDSYQSLFEAHIIVDYLFWQQDCAEEPCREIPVSAILPECDFKPIKVDNVEFFIRDLASEKEETNREFMNSYKDCDVIPTIYEGKKL